MKNFKYLSLLFFVFCNVDSVTIVTHGAFAQNSSWYKSEGLFFETLKKEANNLDHETVSFSWDQDLGGITHYERLSAGIELAKLVLDFAKNGEKQIILIGHSYGGHVIKAASQLLDDFIDDFAMYGVESETIVTTALEKKSIEQSEQEKLDLQQAFLQAQKEVQAHKEKLELEQTKGQKDYFIDAVYTLGTPNDMPDYVANMNVIGNLYNFYSKGDLVQEIVGDVLLPDPKPERAVDLCIEIKNDGWFGWGAPNHAEIHAEIVAQWILHIPFILMEEKIGNFQNFSFDLTGNIFFSKNNPPVYSILDKDEGIGSFGQFWGWFTSWIGLNNNV